MPDKPKVTMYTDGSAPQNAQGHGRGGYCAILVCEGHEKVVSGGLNNTTNNIAELTAILEGLRAIKTSCEVKIVTDSNFCIGTLSLGWKRKDFDCAKVSKQIDELIAHNGHKVSFEHVDGHSGHEYNERADSIARAEADRVLWNNR